MTVRKVRLRMERGARRTIRLALVALPLLLPVPASAASGGAAAKTADPHVHFQNADACPRCHASGRSALSPDRFLATADAFCLGCHSGPGLGISHPIHVRPGKAGRAMTVPDDFPLDQRGRLLCLTCHRAHGPFLSAQRAFPGQEPVGRSGGDEGRLLYRTYYVRRSDSVRGFAPLCEGCHGTR